MSGGRILEEREFFITKRSEQNESVLSFSIRQLADGKIGVNTPYTREICRNRYSPSYS